MSSQRGSDAARQCAAPLPRWPALGVVMLLLVFAPSAWAGGTWGSKADYTNIHVNWSDDAGRPAFYTVFTLSKPVQSATTPDGHQCIVGQPDNNPNQVECQSKASSGSATIVTREPIGCADSIQHKVSEDNRTYIDQRPITSTNACSQPCPK